MSEPNDKTIEDIIQTKLLRLNANINGIVLGIVTGTVIFIATIWLVIKGGPEIGPNLSLLSQFFWGYEVTVVGSFIGFGYGFLFGFFIGYFVSRIYNWLLDLKEKSNK